MQDRTGMNRPAWKVVAGRTARLFGIRFFDLYYGQRDLSAKAEPVVPSLAVEIRLAAKGDLQRIPRPVGIERQMEFDRNRAFGSSCYIAVHEGKVAGYLWVNKKIINMEGMDLANLPAKHAFTHNAYVFREYRNRKIYQFLRRAICHEMYQSGCRVISCLVDKANTRSIEILRQEGIEFQNAGVLKLPGFKPILFCRVIE